MPNCSAFRKRNRQQKPVGISFLKEHKAFVQEQHNMEKLEATVASLVTTVKEQAAQIQKVSTQLEASKPAPQVVNNA
jgi:hypothetical protein